MTTILGISALYHDSAAALIRDGVVVAAASEERFSRIKHDASLPLLAARWCMQAGGVAPADLDYVVYYEKPLRKFERIVMNHVRQFPRGLRAFRRSMASWLTDKLWVRDALVTELGVDPAKVLFSDHHLSHAASAFYCSPFEEAAILTVDGVGEETTTTLSRGGPEGIRRLAEIHFPHSIGLVYSAFTAYLGFQVNDGEYKVMGMAAFGTPRYRDEVERILRRRPDGSFDVDESYVAYHYSAEHSFNEKFVEQFGAPRFPGAPFDITVVAHASLRGTAAPRTGAGRVAGHSVRRAVHLLAALTMNAMRNFVRAWPWWLIPLLLATALWVAASVFGDRDGHRDDTYTVA